MRKVTVGAVVAGLAWACSPDYRAEVGYHEGTEERWYVGERKNYQGCMDEAIRMFNRINSETPGRAFSWACQVWSGNSFTHRVR